MYTIYVFLSFSSPFPCVADTTQGFLFYKAVDNWRFTIVVCTHQMCTGHTAYTVSYVPMRKRDRVYGYPTAICQLPTSCIQPPFVNYQPDIINHYSSIATGPSPSATQARWPTFPLRRDGGVRVSHEGD